MNQCALQDQGRNQYWKDQLILDSRKQLSICLTLRTFYAYGNQLPQNPYAFIAEHWSPKRTVQSLSYSPVNHMRLLQERLKWVESGGLSRESWCPFTSWISVSMHAPVVHRCPGASLETARWDGPVWLASELVLSHSLEACKHYRARYYGLRMWQRWDSVLSWR